MVVAVANDLAEPMCVPHLEHVAAQSLHRGNACTPRRYVREKHCSGCVRLQKWHWTPAVSGTQPVQMRWRYWSQRPLQFCKATGFSHWPHKKTAKSARSVHAAQTVLASWK